MLGYCARELDACSLCSLEFEWQFFLLRPTHAHTTPQTVSRRALLGKEFVKSSNYPVGIFWLRMVSGAFAEEGPKSGGLCPIQFADNIRNENNLCWRMLQYPRNP